MSLLCKKNVQKHFPKTKNRDSKPTQMIMVDIDMDVEYMMHKISAIHLWLENIKNNKKLSFKIGSWLFSDDREAQ